MRVFKLASFSKSQIAINMSVADHCLRQRKIKEVRKRRKREKGQLIMIDRADG